MAEIDFSNVQNILERFGEQVVLNLTNNLNRKKVYPSGVSSDSVASGTLHDSIHFTIEILSDSFSFELRIEDYYKWVNDGRLPGKKPPIKAIENWIRENKIKVSDKSLTKLRVNKQGIFQGGNKKPKPITNEKKIKSLAFAIASGIAKNGTLRTNFYSDVINEASLRDLRLELSTALKQDVLVSIKNNLDLLK